MIWLSWSQCIGEDGFALSDVLQTKGDGTYHPSPWKVEVDGGR